MENALKLSLKKDIFESIKNDGVHELYFEPTSYYLGRLTTSKNNTIEDLKSDTSLFKTFDGVVFSCNDEKLKFGSVEVGLTTNDAGEDVFIVMFENIIEPVVEEKVEIVKEDNEVEVISVEEKVEETVEEQPVELETEVDVPDVENIVLEVTEQIESNDVNAVELDNNILDELCEYPNVYVVPDRRVKLTYMGKLLGCDRRLPIKNEHDFNFILNDGEDKDGNDILLSYEEVENLKSKHFVIVCPELSEVRPDGIKLKYKVLSRLTLNSLL